MLIFLWLGNLSLCDFTGKYGMLLAKSAVLTQNHKSAFPQTSKKKKNHYV